MVLGLILARGGSKRVKGKNLRDLGGIPLIGWTICAARNAYTLDEVVVSSEDDSILEAAREHGAHTVTRPAHMATDEASSYPAILHAVDEHPCDLVCLLQPTSPFRTARHIDECVGHCVANELHAVVAVQTGKDVPNGSIYVGRTDWLRDAVMRHTNPFDTVENHYEMGAEYSLDIDEPEHFELAERMIRCA